jgi:hypothetical protein
LQAQLAVAKKVEEVSEAMQRLEGMAMQSASTSSKGQAEVRHSALLVVPPLPLPPLPLPPGRPPVHLLLADPPRSFGGTKCGQSAESLARLEGMSMSSATNLAKFEKKLTDRTEGLEAMLMQAAMNTSKFEKKMDGRTEG